MHVTAWVIFFIIPGIMNSEPNPRPGMHFPPPAPAFHSDGFWLAFSTLKNLLLIPLFYLNTLYLLPKLLPKQRYGLLVLVEVTLALLQYGYTRLASEIVFPGTHGGPVRYYGVLAYLIVLSITFGLYYFKEAARTERLRKERETASLETELQFLRWQISPHFLFNALNNMVSLARKKSDILEPMLINLSGLMRYMLYETAGTRVSLKKEAQYLESYISLQSIRFDGVELDVRMDVPDTSECYVEPMLLIPFVENAFKHGIDGITSPVIRIRLSVQDSELLFLVSNRCAPAPAAAHDDAHGLGLANVAKRLDLLYEGRHTLAIEQDDWFTVSLKIALPPCFDASP